MMQQSLPFVPKPYKQYKHHGYWRPRCEERHWDHEEIRGKVTLANFYAERLNALDIPGGSFTAAHLFYSPADMPRASLRQLVPFKPDVLARKAHKFLTLANEYSARQRVPRPFVLPNLFTHQSKPKPFECGRNTLPGMERFAA